MYSPNEIQRFMKIIQPIRIIEWDMIKKRKLLGEGAYGKVFQVTITNYEGFLALKIIKPDTNNFEAHFEKIRREVQLLQSCSHPNILPLYGITINYEKKTN